ncbi:MAG: Fic family protein [Lysobacterales bacterium]
MTVPLTTLPSPEILETPTVLRALIRAHRHLAELKGIAGIIPNPDILVSTLLLQEAKDSSEIENIFTTQDEVYQASLFGKQSKNPAAKEVRRYADALQSGFQQIRKDGLITINRIIDFHTELMESNAGIRKLPGTVIKNQATGEVVFRPPQDPNDIQMLLTDLERFVNDDRIYPADPLIQMAVAHHQFESIHPFYDGNGRAGRILNSLFLVAKGLLDAPVLYLSAYIIESKAAYYRLLQSTRDTGEWEPWLIYMIEGVGQTAKNTTSLIVRIQTLMQDFETRIRTALPKIYSYELLGNLFRHPYTKIEAVQNDLGVSRLTASKYLTELSNAGFLHKRKFGKYNYYINAELLRLLERSRPQ